MPHALSRLMGQEVDVDAVDVTVSGILREITEQNVTLWTHNGWVSIPHDRIRDVRAARKQDQEK